MKSDSLAKIVLDRNLHQLSVRAKFFATGIQLFSESESKLPTVDDVVRSVGLSRATFYNYFRDMEAYVHFLVDESLSRLVMEVDETHADATDPLDRIARAVCVCIRYSLDHPHEINLMSRFCRAQLSNESRLAIKFSEDLIAAMLSGQIPETSLESAVCIVLGAASIAMFQLANRPDGWDTMTVAEFLVAGLLSGLGAADEISAALAARSVRVVLV